VLSAPPEWTPRGAKINVISIALPGINSFLQSEVVSVPVSILNTLIDQVHFLIAKVEALEKSQNESQEALNLNIAQDRKRIATLEARPTVTQNPAPRPGSKTADRIGNIGRVLKERGPTVLKEICRLLQILPQELSRILRRLDKRRYDLTTKPGDRRQKVLRIRSWNA
jgi:hypothetical protein